MIKCPFNVHHKILGEGKALNFIRRGEELFARVLFDNNQKEAKEFPVPYQFTINLKATDEAIQSEILCQGKEIKWTYPLILREGRVFYKTGMETYATCCNYLGWDDTKSSAFKQQGIMYAEKATPENYSVWMIVHNSLVEPTYNGASSWYNIIRGEYIEEIWYTYKTQGVSDISIRATFLNTKNGYMFKGLYKLADAEQREINGKLRLVKIYKRISDKYPARPEGM